MRICSKSSSLASCRPLPRHNISDPAVFVLVRRRLLSCDRLAHVGHVQRIRHLHLLHCLLLGLCARHGVVFPVRVALLRVVAAMPRGCPGPAKVLHKEQRWRRVAITAVDRVHGRIFADDGQVGHDGLKEEGAPLTRGRKVRGERPARRR
jgi:hypothetical protein